MVCRGVFCLRVWFVCFVEVYVVDLVMLLFTLVECLMLFDWFELNGGCLVRYVVCLLLCWISLHVCCFLFLCLLWCLNLLVLCWLDVGYCCCWVIWLCFFNSVVIGCLLTWFFVVIDMVICLLFACGLFAVDFGVA